MLVITTLTVLSIGCSNSKEPSTTATTAANELAAIKTYTLENAAIMQEASAKLANLSTNYLQLAEQVDFDYEKLFSEQSTELNQLLTEAKEHWLTASAYYEINEGIIAGVPTLSDFDVWIDAGPSGSEDPVEARDWTLKLKNGEEFEKPGNIFHGLLEPIIWGTDPSKVKLAVDLNNDGQQAPSEVLPEAYFFEAAANSLNQATAEMIEAVNEWEPTLTDVFAALTTMVPTMNEYFEQWKLSYYIAGEQADQQAFVAISRLADIKGILTGLEKAYGNISQLVDTENPTLNKQISQDFNNLIKLVNTLYAEEQAGKKFSGEQADQYGEQAQTQANNLAGKLTQAAEALNISVE